MTQSRMTNLSIKLGMIDKNPSSMHREYNEFYAVHVYLRSIRISLVGMLPSQKLTIKIVSPQFTHDKLPPCSEFFVVS